MTILYWYTKDPKGRRTCNGITIAKYNQLIWAQATCSKKDRFTKHLARTIVAQRIDKTVAQNACLKSVRTFTIDTKLSLKDKINNFDIICVDPQGNDMNEECRKMFIGRIYNLLKRFE